MLTVFVMVVYCASSNAQILPDNSVGMGTASESHVSLPDNFRLHSEHWVQTF